MKTVITAIVAAAVIAVAGTISYACGGMGMGGMNHGSGDAKMDHEGNMEDHALMSETQVNVTMEQVEETATAFVKKNIPQAKIGGTALTESDMMDMSQYTTELTLADDTKATLYTDPETGEVLGMTFGETMGMFHAQCPMDDEMHTGGMSGDQDESADSGAGMDHSKHNQ